MDFLGVRSDLYLEKNNLINEFKDISITKSKNKKFTYHTIHFENICSSLKDIIKKELVFFLKKLKLPLNFTTFVVGLGSKDYTSDSIGPKVLKYLNVNYYLNDLGISQGKKLASLEPGVLGETGIDTKRIVESVTEEINPDVVILIDSFIVKNAKYLNHTIEITNEGIVPGSGILGLNSSINHKTIGVPVIVIGVPTAIELNIDNKKYILSSSDIDKFSKSISKLIGIAINEALCEF